MKIGKNFTINKITTGFLIALLSAGAIYLDWLGFVNFFVNTLLGLLSLYLLLQSDKKIWFWSGFWIGVLWFWWISVSFKNYGFAWAIPIGVILTAMTYGFIFLFMAKIAEFVESKTSINQLFVKSFLLLIISYLHPFAFDWFKPEMIFTNSYLGVQKWQFALILLSISLTLYKKEILFLLLTIFAYPFTQKFNQTPLNTHGIVLSNSMTNVVDKWDPKLQPKHVEIVFQKIERAIKEKRRIIIFPESVFAFFLNTQPELMTDLQALSNEITIVIGALYWDGKVNRNSTYIFQKGQFKIANKAVLVPFGEYNPLPKWLGEIINKIFFDGAPDYVASSEVTDYTIDGITYRNAICFEATSKELYKGDPKNMIAISNNGWVTPSIEPTEQKILLQFYSKKYGTTIFHAVNMSPSYIIHQGRVIQ
jgi:apolipoprotein N-acyltransferase